MQYKIKTSQNQNKTVHAKLSHTMSFIFLAVIYTDVWQITPNYSLNF